MHQDSPFEEAKHFLHFSTGPMTSPFLTKRGRRFSNGWQLKVSLLSLTLFLLAFASSFFLPSLASLLLVVVYFISGTPALIRVVTKLTKAHISIDTLMVLAALLSFIIGSALEGALLLVLFALSEAIEESVSKKNQASLLALDKLAPTKANAIDDAGQLHQKSIHDIPVGSHILIRPGDIVPLDGFITKGASSVKLSHLTGESAPLYKTEGDEVPAGSQNLEGSFTLKVSRTSSNSTLAKMQKLMQTAAEEKPKIQTLLERLGKPYATTIILLSCFFALTLPLVFSMPYLGLEGSIYRSLSFLIAASPCALIIATPTAYLAAISSLVKKGILVKGGTFLDALAKSRGIAFDKTGTLTTGELTFEKIESLTPDADITQEQALQLAYTLSINSDHPISKSITSYAKEAKTMTLALSDFKAQSGFGVSGLITDGDSQERAFLGRPDFLLTNNKALSENLFDPSISSTTTYLMYKDAVYRLTFNDTVREAIPELMDELKKASVTTYLLSGDKKAAAMSVAKALHINTVHAELTPGRKLELIDELSQKAPLAMVGDGINDAPALKRAAVGLSMGEVGNPTAIEAADIVFMKDNLHELGRLIKKAKKTRRIISQNFVFALTIIFGISIPSLFGFIPLFLAVILHEGSTILVGLNSLRLLKNR